MKTFSEFIIAWNFLQYIRMILKFPDESRTLSIAVVRSDDLTIHFSDTRLPPGCRDCRYGIYNAQILFSTRASFSFGFVIHPALVNREPTHSLLLQVFKE